MMKKDTNRFEFDLPDGWQDQTVFHFRGPVIDDQEHLLTLVIDRFLQQTDVREFARPRTQPVLAALQGVEVLKDEETTVPGCYPSYEFVYRWMPVEGVKIFKKQIFVLRESAGYAFDIEFSKKSYKMLGEQVKKVIENLLPGTYEPREDR
ncbi:MAG: DcrB-related protein [Candidatus Krumholzibacteria bacterium]|nr:DcrB-related protein [Candidatus Krumholzibacteria bacterium]